MNTDLYFDVRGCYWTVMNGRYVALAKEDVKLHALREGIRDKAESNLTPLESLFWRAQFFRTVSFAGALAGHRCGPIRLPSGELVLITSECNAFDRKPAKGKPFPFIEGFMDALFVDGGDHVIAWLAVALRSLLTGDFRPGQMLALAGPPGCGKSFFHVLTTELLGGRSAKPYSYLTGKTPFNGDIARAEHLVIEDEAASTDIRARRTFGAGVKQFTVAAEMFVHDKGKIAVTLPTFKRLSLSVNDEPENLMILPPFDASLSDKIMLIRCKDAKPALFEDRRENMERLRKELPAFHAYLLRHRVPDKIKCERFGVVAFHDPDLLDTLNANQPEARLSDLIEEVFFAQSKGETQWRGTATELERQLRNSAFAAVASQLFYYTSACGVFLGRLASKHPDRFRQIKRHGRVEWEIKRCE